MDENKINAAFKAAQGNDQLTAILTALFGEQQAKETAVEKDNRPVTKRVKTFEDAVRELGNDNPFVQAYYNNALFDTDKDNTNEVSDIIAYLQLRIIVAALNEGWTPQFTEDEYRWFPWYILWTQSEYDELSEERKAKCRRVVYRSVNHASASGGVAYAYAVHDSAYSSAYIGSRLNNLAIGIRADGIVIGQR